MDQVIALLQQLSAAGQAFQAAADAEDTAGKLRAIKAMPLDSNHVAAARRLSSSTQGTALWDQLAALHVPLADVSRALAGIMALASQSQALLAAAVYSHLLITAGCPVFSLFDRGMCGAFLKLLREAATCKRAGGGKGDGKKAAAAGNADAMHIDPAGGSDGEGVGAGDDAFDGGEEEVEQRPSQRGKALKKHAVSGGSTPAGALAEPLRNLAALLAGFGLRDQPDTVRNVAEAAAEVSRCGASAGGGEWGEACYAVLGHLLQPIHGSVREQAAMVFRLLTPNILGAGAEGGKGAAGAARQAGTIRARAIQFTKDCLRRSPECREAVAALARHVILKAPDKADFRAAAVEGAVALAGALEPPEQQQFVGFVARLSRTPKVSQRQMAVELAPAILEGFDDPFAPVDLPPLRAGAAGEAQGSGAGGKTPANQTVMVDGQELMAAPWGAVCLAVLVQRCSDKAAVVRGRAMQNLAGVVAAWTSFNGGNSREEVRFCAALSLAHEVKLQPQPLLGATPGLLSPSVVSPAATDEPGDTPMAMNENTPHPNNTTAARRRVGGASKPTGGAHSRTYSCFTMPALLEGGEADLRSLLHSARKRCSDEKGQVRKAAVQLLEALLVMRAAGVQRTLPQAKDVAAIEAATGDVLVSVRKAGLTAAHSLLKALPDQPAVAALWVRAALPLVRDVEASIQEAVLDQVQDLVTGRAVAAGAAGREGRPTSSAEKAAGELSPILAAFAAGGGACKACVGRACCQLKAKSRLRTKQAATGLQNIIQGLGAPSGAAPTGSLDADAVAGAWLLFTEISAQDPGAPSWQFLQQQWDTLMQQQSTPQHSGVGAQQDAGATSSGDASNNAAQLLKVIAAAAAEFPAEQAHQMAEQLLRALRGFTLPPAAAAAHVAAVAQLTARHRGGVGAWAPELLVGAEKVLGEYVDSYQAGRAQAGMQGDDWRAAGALFIAGEVALLRACKPSGRLVVLVQALTASRLALGPASASQASQAEGLTGEGVSDVPGTVQAHSWVALGKLCLTDEPLAKKCVPLFVQELGRAAQPAVRNNIMVALADLVINYTALVDSHIPRLASCIRDPNELVRTQALALLANLLQKDYVKWRGPLFHRFLLALIDDSPRVCALAEYLLGDTIATKLPNLAYNHFVEALFVLNDCQTGLHGGAAAAAAVSEAGSGGVADRDAFCLRGCSPRIRAKRDAIYKALLQRMSPEHKFATAARLCQEVLGGAADGALPLEECQEVLGDALRILASKHIKVTASRAAAEDLDGDPAAVVGAAKGKLVSAMMKKHLVEGVVPVVIELKRGMEAARHPLLGDLMAATAAMLKDYKNEIEDILVADKQLAKEILYDIRQAELAKQAAKAAPASDAAAGAAAGAGTPLTGGAGRQSGLPAGTSTGTPIAAQVLLTARKAAAGAPAAGSGGTPAPGGALPARTPGGGLLPTKTPGSGYKTPGVAATAAKMHSTGGRTISRLARASGPQPSPQPDAALGSAGGAAGPLSAPRLRTATGCTPAGTSRLRHRDQDALAQQTAALTVADGGANAAADEGDEEQQVVLPFPVPGAPGAAAPQQWNVSAEAAQLPADMAQQDWYEATAMECGPQEEGEAEAGGVAGSGEGEGRSKGKGRGKRRQGSGSKDRSPENAAPAVNGKGTNAALPAAAGVAVKEEGHGASGKGRTSRKRKA